MWYAWDVRDAPKNHFVWAIKHRSTQQVGYYEALGENEQLAMAKSSDPDAADHLYWVRVSGPMTYEEARQEARRLNDELPREAGREIKG